MNALPLFTCQFFYERRRKIIVQYSIARPVLDSASLKLTKQMKSSLARLTMLFHEKQLVLERIMKIRQANRAKSAGAATAARLSLPAINLLGIPEAEFQRIVEAAQRKDLNKLEMDSVLADQERARIKRKNAILTDDLVQAASASNREATIAKMIGPYAKAGVGLRSGQKKGGKTAGAKQRQRGEQTKIKVHELVTQLLLTRAPHQIAGIIAAKLRLSSRHVRNHLRTHPCGKWKKKEMNLD